MSPTTTIADDQVQGGCADMGKQVGVAGTKSSDAAQGSQVPSHVLTEEASRIPWVPMAPMRPQAGRPWGICGVGSDADDLNDEIPGRFIRGLQNDTKAARERWQKTKQWRKAEGIDWMLEEPQPGYFQFKTRYPHYYHKKSKKGEYLYVEKPGVYEDCENLWKNGFCIDQMARHYVFTSEYMWRIADRNDDNMIISLFDLKGCALTQLSGSQFQLFKQCTGLIGDHYPERSKLTILINVPWWFSTGWAIVKNFIDPRTCEKIIVLKGPESYQPKLLELFRAEDLPVELGGTDTDKLGKSPIEKEIAEHVKKINSRFGYPTSFKDGVEPGAYNDFKFTPPDAWKDIVNEGVGEGVVEHD